MASIELDPGRWLLQCPVDETLIAPGVTECGECGLSVEPLRALASTAAVFLRTAAAVDSSLAIEQVDHASALVPESENYLLDAGRALGAAGAYESARTVLDRAAGIAPGRKDIKAELAALAERIDPTGWLTEGLPVPAVDEEPEVSPAEPEQALIPAQPRSRREELKARSRAAWQQQDLTEPGSAEYWALGHEMTRIAIEIAALSSDGAATEGPRPV